jgi:hypothetical protein
MTFIACLLVARLVYPSDDRRAAGSTTAIQIFAASDLARLRADDLEPAPGGLQGIE